MWVSANIAIYAIGMTKLDVNGNLVMLQPESSQQFSEKDHSIIKYEADQSSMNSPSFIVFHYYLQWDVDVAHYTIMNALFNTEK